MIEKFALLVRYFCRVVHLIGFGHVVVVSMACDCAASYRSGTSHTVQLESQALGL
jgi:hypothetical protein